MRSTWAVLAFYIVFTAYSIPANALKEGEILPRASNGDSSLLQPLSSTSASASISAAVPSSRALSSTDSSAGSPSSVNSKSSTMAPTEGGAASDTSTGATPSSSPPSSSTARPSIAQATYSASNGTALDQLPVKPAITPALSLAGAILMMTGVVYTLIGIKTKWVHIFLSSAYLVSLAVTVLIIYVMHPPIPNAIQGAYFVAASVTGVAFGMGSVIFPDITECLGCLLGGFCLSMWLLVLRPGGLVRSTVGNVVMIACFSVATTGLYFHRFTRPYGLIGSTSFAGATAIVIGIDCFSRAGLKEFWMYIWNLNDDVFPPHYTGPYPITRGMTVEIVAIVLLFLLGVTSQFKVWKIVKKRKEQKEAYQLAEQRGQEQAELDLGRRLEEGNIQEKVRWEATYGGQNPIVSGRGTDATSTPHKNLASVHEGEVLEEGSATYAANKRMTQSDNEVRDPTRITVRVASEDSIYELPSSTAKNLLSVQQQEHQGVGTSSKTRETPRSHTPSVASSEWLSAEPVEYPRNQSGPSIIPLPFKVGQQNAPEDDDRSSVATCAASDCVPARWSQYSSGSGLQSKRMSNQSANTGYSTAVASDDGRPSSVAATIDDIGDDASSRGDLSELGADTVPPDGEKAGASERLLLGGDVALLTSDNLRAGDRASSNGDAPSPTPPEDSARLVDHDEKEATDTDRGRGYLGYSLKPTSSPPAIPERSPSRMSVLTFHTSQEQIDPDTLRDQLPEGASKVAMAYRTNEWAKHLEQAELPAVDDLRIASQPVDEAPIMAEAVVPVQVKALQQTPLTAEPAPQPNKTRPENQRAHLYRSTSARDSLPSQQKHREQMTSLHRSSMGRILDRPSSQVSLPRRNRRSSSTPMLASTLAESPIEEDVEMKFPKRISSHPTNALMARRSGKLQARYSTSSLGRTNSAYSLVPVHPQVFENTLLAHRQFSHRSSRPNLIPRTSATLTSPMQSPNLIPRTSATLTSPMQSPNHLQRRDTIAANWRSSLQQDPRASNQALSNELEGRQAGLLLQQRRSSAGIEAAELEKARREREADRAMRRGDMLEAHQRAMRKMQATVKQ